jgi:uncharacterized protein (DUF4415 family)
MLAPMRIRVATIGGVTYRRRDNGALEPLSTAEALEAHSRAMTDWARREMSEPGKQPVTIRLDRDVVDWFKDKGPRYQTRINSALRRYVEAQRESGAA